MMPKPVAGEVIELAFTVQDPTTGIATNITAATAPMFDSLVCGTQYQSDSTLNNFYWQTYDLYTNQAKIPSAVTGSFASSYTTTFDTALKGYQDWQVSPELSQNTCTATYCTFTCTAFRPMQTFDANDIQYTVGSTYYATASFKKYPTASATTTSIKGQSLSPFTAFVLTAPTLY